MKKTIAFLISLILAVSLSACKGEGNIQSVSSTAATEESSVIVSKDAFPQNTEVKVEAVKETAAIAKAIPTAKSVTAYDINAFLDNKKLQPNGEVEVTFPIPSDFDASLHNIEVYYIADNGETEKIEATVSDGGVIAKLKHFSVYAVVVVEKPMFNIAVLIEGEYKVELVDGFKYFTSKTNMQFDYNEKETWRTFIERNKDKGFEIGKDFYGKRDAIYYTYNGVKYEVVDALNVNVIKPDDAITLSNYAAMIPHRETIQGQWFYDVSNKPFAVEGESEPFDRQGKIITLDIPAMTYIIKHEKLKKISANSFVRNEEIIAEGKYTSSDGDTLGATLTLDNGYILKTTRSDSFSATLIIDGKSKAAKTENHIRFYSFS